MIEDQAYELRKRASSNVNKKSARTIAVFSGKGGVGKSSFALNFAICLSSQGKKVLIMDLDLGMGNIDILLGTFPKHTLISMLDDQLRIDDIIEKGPNNLSYVAAGTSLSSFFHLDFDRYEYFLKQFEDITERYDYIIFDLGAGMSEEHMAFISAADECFVVTTTEPTSITDAYAAIKHLILETPDVKISIMVNRVSGLQESINVYERLNLAVHNFLSREINLLGSLPEDRTVITAVKEQTPFYILERRARVSKAMAKMALDYLKANHDLRKEDKGQFIQKLKSIFNRKVD